MGCRFPCKGQFWAVHCKVQGLCSELCKNGWTDQDAILDVDWGGPRKYVLYGVTLAQPGEYDWTIHERRWCDIKLLWPLVNVATDSHCCVWLLVKAACSSPETDSFWKPVERQRCWLLSNRCWNLSMKSVVLTLSWYAQKSCVLCSCASAIFLDSKEYVKKTQLNDLYNLVGIKKESK